MISNPGLLLRRNARFLILVFVTIAFSHLSFAQSSPLEKAPLPQKPLPLVVIDSFRTDMRSLVCNPNNIDSINVLKGANAVSRFGEVGREGVIIIVPKKSTHFLTLDHLLDQYSLPATDRKLPVAIDHIPVVPGATILIDESEFKTIEIIDDISWITSGNAGNSSRILNIVTRSQYGLK